MDLEDKRILVTGGAGFVGSHLIALLRERGCREISAPRSAECDLVDRDAVRRLYADFRPDLPLRRSQGLRLNSARQNAR
jgi:GDP-L-fucose synthase